MSQGMIIDAISTELIQILDSLCKQCGITNDHFINSTSEVIDDIMHTVIGIYYTSYIVYSSPEGNVTASTLVTLLQQWLLEAEKNEMEVTVDNAHLVIFEFCGFDNNNADSASKELCLSTWLKSVSCLVNNINLHPSSLSPTKFSFNNSQMKVNNTSMSHSNPFPTENSVKTSAMQNSVLV